MACTYALMACAVDQQSHTTVFTFAMEMLGVKVFKKYWPVNGSVWNAKHMNPRSARDLHNVILASEDNIRIHTTNLIRDTVDTVVRALCEAGAPHQMQIKAFTYAFRAYIIAVQYYNRTLAYAALQELQQFKPLEFPRVQN